ncbi:hypothetical protein C8A01DRAFT_21457 [Parachaetomium inaequale]|uniref:Rhodopsin domain-containing protein n=1 Tax=Parachaetomium inaequale TaxID=2588326 RepID=A0AAN6SKT1_9PEZI|nr:hypothetical protein C8A01DRAFT_21457 [Parachaetomium inaequale]
MEHNESNLGPLLLGINITAVILAGITCLLRCYVRLFMLKAFGLDDWLMVISTIIFITYSVCSNTGVHYGTGQHRSDLSEENYMTAMKWWFMCYPTYGGTMFFAKLSIGWFLLRVTISRIHRWIIYTAAIVTCASCLCYFFVALFQCNPISYYWDKHSQTGTCIDVQIVIWLVYLYSGFAVISDFTFALLPAWVVSRLNMKKNMKIAVIILMGMGCIAAVVIRWPYMQRLGSNDFLWDSIPIAIWSTVEQCLAITAGCLATLQPLVKMIRSKLGMTTTHPTLGNSESYNMNGAISVKKSFTRWTEPSSLNGQERDLSGRSGGLKFQPGFAEYSATCYNTSQEELRPDRAGTARLGSGNSKESKGGIELGIKTSNAT